MTPITSSLSIPTRIIVNVGEKAEKNVASGAGPTPEDINKTVRSAELRVEQTQDNTATQKQTRVDIGVEVVAAKQQQASVDRFISASTKQANNTNNPDFGDITQLARTLKINTAANAIDSSGIDRQDVQEFRVSKKQEDLQNLLDGIGRPDTPASVDFSI